MTKNQHKCSTLAIITWIAFCFYRAQVACGQDANEPAKTSLRIVGFFPAHNSTIWPGGFYCIPAALLAVEQINSANLLPGYELDFKYLDSGGCGRDVAVQRYLQEIASETTPPVAIIGPGCSESALTLASFSAQPRREVLTVSYGATTPTLSNLVAFPYFLRTVPPQIPLADSMARFVERFKWDAVVTLYEDGNIQRSTVLQFRAALGLSNMAIDESSTFKLSGILNDTVTDEVTDLLNRTLEQIRDSHKRIIFAFVHKGVGRELMELVANNSMTYPEYVWIFPELFDGWWNLSCNMDDTNCTQMQESGTDRPMNGSNCTCTQMQESSIDPNCMRMQESINRAMYGAIHINYFFGHTDDVSNYIHVSNISVSEYTMRLENQTNEFLDSYNQENRIDGSCGEFSSTTYDAVWAVALGLAATEQKLQNLSLSLADHAENFATITQVLHSSILNDISFVGASGNINFNHQGYTASPTVKFRQVHNASEFTLGEEIGVYSMDNLSTNTSKLLWDPNSPPKATVTIKQVTAMVSQPLVIIVFLLAFLLFVFNCVFLMVNFTHRNSGDVKATSPSLNIFVFSGHFIVLTHVLLFTIINLRPELDSGQYSVLCNLMPWTLSVGYSLINGTIFWKTWRLYKIFSVRIDSKEKWFELLKDEILIFGIIAVVVVSDIVPLTLFSVLTPLHKMVLNTTSSDQLMETTASVCALSNLYDKEFLPYITISLILVFKALLLVFVTFSAVMLLRANLPEKMALYNDSGLVLTFTLVQIVLYVLSLPIILVYFGDPNYETRLSATYAAVVLFPLVIVAASLGTFGYKYRNLPKLLWKQLRKRFRSQQTVDSDGAKTVYRDSLRHSSLPHVTLTMYSMQALYSPRFPRHSRMSSSSSGSGSFSYTSPRSSNVTSIVSISSGSSLSQNYMT